jgi:hypothetical protein
MPRGDRDVHGLPGSGELFEPRRPFRRRRLRGHSLRRLEQSHCPNELIYEGCGDDIHCGSTTPPCHSGCSACEIPGPRAAWGCPSCGGPVLLVAAPRCSARASTRDETAASTDIVSRGHSSGRSRSNHRRPRWLVGVHHARSYAQNSVAAGAEEDLVGEAAPSMGSKVAVARGARLSDERIGQIVRGGCTPDDTTT